MADFYATIAQTTDDARPAITAVTALVNCGDLGIEGGIPDCPFARLSLSRLAISGSRHLQHSAHSAHTKLVAVLFDPGVLHRDSFAKYAAAFFTISKSSRALSNSRRSREFSASTSASDRFTAVAAGRSVVPNLLVRPRSSQFRRLPSGIPNRFAAVLTPTDSLNLTASTLNSSVYCR